MKTLTALLLITLAGCVSGPSYPPEFRNEIKANHLRNSRYLELMRDGKTSKIQDIDMQRANADAWKKLSEIMEGAK
ncbi:MAG: hypothetical protein KDD43_00885 [Bdellovibrionales bacterium]|nr:hypothetical protein [Bdellovibrionales bacterium]